MESTSVDSLPSWDSPFKGKTKAWMYKVGIVGSPIPKPEQNTSVLQSVSKWLPPRDEHSDYWWNMAGSHFATLFCNAGYSLEAQYEALLFVYHHVVPRLGVSPRFTHSADSEDSRLSLDRTHIEYSWRWNQFDTKPEVHMVMEPFSQLAGTCMDPLNLKPATEILYSMKPQVPSLDMTLFNHFIGKLYDGTHHKYLEMNEKSSMMNVCLGFDFVGRDILPKAYFFPRKLGQVGTTPMEVWEETIAAAIPQSTTMNAVFSFVKNDSPKLGLTLTPLWLGLDVIDPADSRLKLYCVESRTSFESVKTVLSMGGTVQHSTDMLDQIWDLMKAVCGLPDGFSRDEELPKAPRYNASTDGLNTAGLLGHFVYYFDIGVRRENVPDIKLYIPVCHYGSDDEAIATATTTWMKKNGRGQYVNAYRDCLHKIISHRKLEASRGAHMWISMMIKGGKLQVTTYIAPEGHHPNRQRGAQGSH